MQFEIEDEKKERDGDEKIKQNSGFGDEQSAARLGVSIRLLGPMMMQDSKHPICWLAPQFQKLHAKIWRRR